MYFASGRIGVQIAEACFRRHRASREIVDSESLIDDDTDGPRDQ